LDRRAAFHAISNAFCDGAGERRPLARAGGCDLTYCLGILVADGLVLASDSRSSAGVDNVAEVSKLAILTVPGNRVVAIQSAGNLATTQSVIRRLRQALGSGEARADLGLARTMVDVADLVGEQLRQVVTTDGAWVKPYGDPSASFLVSGQIAGEAPQLFEIYSAGNFVQATERSCFLQIGETKYGKPILDRALEPTSSLDEAEKLALLSFDATLRSNLSVGLPIDIFRYRADSFAAGPVITLQEDTPYWRDLRRLYSEGLNALVATLPLPPEGWRA
jgi:putative proteasome-type protease